MPDSSPASAAFTRVLVAHPSPDLYGSDRQLLETVVGLVEAGCRVDVLLPSPGPLADELVARGASVRVVSFPVLRKSALRPRALPRLALDMARATLGARRLLRRERPDAVLVNTVTVPSWLVASRLAGVPAVCHVHEAEADQPFPVRLALAAPLLLARVVVANSRAAAEVPARALPALRARTRVVHNGISGPPDEPGPPRARRVGDPVRLALVARLSPRKGVDVAVDALAELVDRGVDASLVVAGTPFAGYEWYEQQLADSAARPSIAGRVTLLGYVHPTWPVLADADVVLVPSRVEPFGNTAVEALLARRPLVASRTQGLAEIVRDARTGLLVEPGDPRALADAVVRLADDPALASTLAEAGRDDARERFSVDTYRRAMLSAIADAVTPARNAAQ